MDARAAIRLLKAASFVSAVACFLALTGFSPQFHAHAQTNKNSSPSTELSAKNQLADGIWISRASLAELPTSGPAWNHLKSKAEDPCGSVDLSDQDSKNNVCILAKALVYARTGKSDYQREILSALRAVAGLRGYSGRALSLGRKLGTYVIAADIINVKQSDPALDQSFRARIKSFLTAPTEKGPRNLIECHELRPNNWGTHCGATRAAIDAYLGDMDDLARVAKIFKGWLGDRSSYDGFKYGDDLSWQCNPSKPVGINPVSCAIQGHSVDGVLPDDQRRGGSFTWPPPQENYVYEALQGALVQAVILQRAGYPAFAWQDQALLRAFQWLHSQDNFPAKGDDTWEPHLVNYFYGTDFPTAIPASPGKNVGWTDWTHSAAKRRAD